MMTLTTATQSIYNLCCCDQVILERYQRNSESVFCVHSDE